MSDMIPLRSKDTVPFHCGRCAACCRNIKDTIMVEPIDAFRLARFFHGRSGYSQIRGVEGVYSWFTHISTLEGIFPIYLMNATGPEGACTFLENGRCSVYEARPRVCPALPVYGISRHTRQGFCILPVHGRPCRPLLRGTGPW